MRTHSSQLFALICTTLLLASEVAAQSPSARRPSASVRGNGHAGPFVTEARGGGAPANDECATAEALTLLADGECETMATTGDNGGSVNSTGDPGCDASNAGFQDVWYSFNSGDNALVLINLTPVDPAVMTDHGFVLLDGCDGAEVACQVLPAGAVNIAVTPNTDYVLRVYSNVQFGVGGPFTLCVTANGYPPPPPANDLCSSVTAEALSIGTPLTFTGDVTSATMTDDFAPGSDLETNGSPTAWHAFTTTECTNVAVSYCGTPSVFNNVWIFVSANCPAGDDIILGASYDFTTCPDGNATIRYEGLAAGTYYLPVMWDEAAGATGPYTITVDAIACPLPPANDDCAGATDLEPGETCVPTAGTTMGATQSMDPLLCNGFTSNNSMDAWYSFTATATDHTITVQGSATFDAVVELFSGACGGLTSMNCADATITDPAGAIEEIVQTGLTVGTVYYVRVYTYNNGAADKTFTICVTGESFIGIHEGALPVAFSIFPNPTDGRFTLNYTDASALVGIDLLDMAGRTVFTQQRRLEKGQNVELDLAAELSAGVYSLRLTTATGRSEQRVMVK